MKYFIVLAMIVIILGSPATKAETDLTITSALDSIGYCNYFDQVDYFHHPNHTCCTITHDELSNDISSSLEYVLADSTNNVNYFVYQGEKDYLVLMKRGESFGYRCIYVINDSTESFNHALLVYLSELQTEIISSSDSSSPACWINNYLGSFQDLVPYYPSSIINYEEKVVYNYFFSNGIVYTITMNHHNQIISIETKVNQDILYIFSKIA
ncbi:MAG: hypothetical protein E7329_07980 [Clostridiales bacterium]|nr:hypothetical protein [Clostridiales bacterium]